jgi:ribosomal protein L11
MTIVTRGKTVREAENIANIQLSKISSLAKGKKFDLMSKSQKQCY